MPHKWQGISNKNNTLDHLQTAVILGKINKGLPVELKQKVVKEAVRRGKYNNPEAQLRKEVIKYLRRKGCKVWRIETAVMGQLGLPDVLCFYGGRMTWVELKSSTGRLSEEQIGFKLLCETSGVNHLVARNIEDLKEIFFLDNNNQLL